MKRQTGRVRRAATAILLTLTATALLLQGCAKEEPRYKNMPVSIYIKRIVANSQQRTIDESIDALIAIGGPAVPYLRKAWKKHTDTDIRCRIATVYQGIGPDAAPALPDLTEAINAINEQLISCAAFAMGGIGPAAAPNAEKLGSLLRSSDTTTQINLLYALGGIGPQAASQIPLVMEALERERTRTAAIEALGKMGSQAVKAVDKWLENGTPDQRLAACQVLAGSGESVAEVLPGLVKALSDSDSRVRLAAARAIGQAGEKALSVESDLIKALADRNDDVRTAVVNALVSIGPDAGKLLIQALNNRNSRVREGAARVIGHYSNLVLDARSRLISRLDDPNVRVRLAVIDALSSAGKDIVPIMIRQLGSSNVLRKFGAIRVLGNIGSDAQPALPKLAKLVNDKDSLIREEVQKAIASIRR